MKKRLAAEGYRFVLRYGVPALVLAAGIGWAPGAAAQGAPSESTATDEVIVTAQKREEALSDVPMSITAVTAETLTDYGINDVSELTRIVPGFSFQRSTFGVPVYTLRGVGFYERGSGSSPAVSIYSDQVPLTYAVTSAGAVLDLERVEVLKGPQGTLFGQNATGGAINYVAARPTREFEAGGDFSIGNFGYFEATGFVSGPLTDTLAARLAFRSNNREGWQESHTRPGDENAAVDFLQGRLLLDWTPSNDWTFQFAASTWHDESETQAGQYLSFNPNRNCATNPAALPAACAALVGNPQGYPTPNDDASSADWDAGRDLANDATFTQFSLRADWDISDTVTLTSISAQTDFEETRPTDPDGTNYKDYSDIRETDISTTFQELRLSGMLGDRALWMLGVNYQSEQADEIANLDFAPTNSTVGPFAYQVIDFVNWQDSETSGVFGSFDYDLTNTLTLRASARYTTYERTFQGGMRDSGDGQMAAAFSFLSDVVLGGPPVVIAPGGWTTLTSPLNPAPVVDGVHNVLSEDNVSYRFGLDWSPNEDTLWYANVARGYKSGNFPILPGVFADQFRPVTGESVIAYEVGTKLSFVDGRVRLNAAAFYYDYIDKQLLGTTVFPVFGPLPLMDNIPSAHIQGVEVDLTVRPTDGLRLSLSATYLNSEIDEDPADPRDALGGINSYVGESIPATPDLQLVAGVDYTFPLTGQLRGFAGANYSYRSSTNASPGYLPLYDIDAYGLLDLRAGVESNDGRWRISLWGRNVTDEYYWSNTARAIDTVVRFTGMPQTYGATLSVRFD